MLASNIPQEGVWGNLPTARPLLSLITAREGGRMCGPTRLGDQLELSVLPYLTVPPPRAARPRVLVSKLHAWTPVRSTHPRSLLAVPTLHSTQALHNLVPDPELTPSCRTELRKGHDYFQHSPPPSLSLQPSSVFGTILPLPQEVLHPLSTIVLSSGQFMFARQPFASASASAGSPDSGIPS